MRRVHLLLFVVMLGSACSRATDPGGSEHGFALERVRAEPYSLTFYSGLVEPQRLVVEDEAEWRAVWSAIWGRHSPEPPLPQVDFAREFLVVAALGERSSGGYGILVDSAFVDDDGIVVQVRTFAPGAACVVTAALTQPVDVARIPRPAGAVRFRDRATVRDCR